jgi:hypothetical protein
MAFTLFPKQLKQWKVVLIAFATATTFWFFNSLNKQYTTNLKHPVEFVFPNDSLIAVKKLPAEIELDVTSGGWTLLRKSIRYKLPPISIRLKNPVGAKFISWMEMLPQIREQLPEITVNSVLHDTLNIRIEPMAKKKVKIKVDSLSINLKANHRMVSSILIPENEVELTGPKSFIDTIRSEYTIAITEKNISDDFDGPVRISLPKGGLVSAKPALVNVSFSVDRFDRLQIELPITPVNFPTDSSKYLKQNVMTVFFTVQRSLQTEYTKKKFQLIADLKSVSRRDTAIAPVLTKFPPEISEISLSPTKVSIIKKR